jgi:N-acyl-D-amino-acid deacylase
VARDSASQFEKFDETIRDFAASNQVSAITCAISRHGEILHQQAFGFSDFALKNPLAVNARFRIASISKPITSAAIKMLMRDGKLKADERVMDFFPSPTWPHPSDALWHDITIQHLLDHRGGWDRAVLDPMFADKRIKKETGSAPVRPDDVVRWTMSQPLQFDPGSKSVYANFGYCVLGRVIESVTKKSYLDFIQETVAKPCGVTTWALSRTGALAALPDEVRYDFAQEGEHFRIELMDSHGGLVSSAADLCRFMNRYWLTGDARTKSAGGHAMFFGSLPGTTAIAVQRADGLDYAVLLNKRSSSGEAQWHESLRELLDQSMGR